MKKYQGLFGLMVVIGSGTRVQALRWCNSLLKQIKLSNNEKSVWS